MNRNRQSGYSFIEVLLGLGIATAVSAGIWAAFAGAQEKVAEFQQLQVQAMALENAPMDPNACWLNPDGTLPAHCK